MPGICACSVPHMRTFCAAAHVLCSWACNDELNSSFKTITMLFGWKLLLSLGAAVQLCMNMSSAAEGIELNELRPIKERLSHLFGSTVSYPRTSGSRRNGQIEITECKPPPIPSI